MQSICCYEGAGLHWTCILYKTPFRKRKKSPIHQPQLRQGETLADGGSLGGIAGGLLPHPKQLLKAFLPQQPPSPKRVVAIRTPLPLCSTHGDISPPPLGQGPVHLCRRPAPRLMWLRFPATPLGTWSVLRPVQRLGGRAPPQAVGIQGKHSTPCRTQDTQFRRPILGRGSGVRPRADEAVGCRSG